MGGSSIAGMGLLVVGGVCGGSFTLLMRFSRWSWEAKWFVFSLLSYGIFPWILAAATLQDLADTYTNAGIKVVMETAIFGFLWGIGSQLFGLGVHMVGNSLGQTIIIGLCATIGSIGPLLIFHMDEVWSTQGICNWISLVLTVVGLVACGYAGMLKERDLSNTSGEDTKRVFVPGESFRSAEEQSMHEALLDADEEGGYAHGDSEGDGSGGNFMAGLIVCVLSGLFSACLNFAVTFGKDIKDAAMDGGASDTMSANSVSAIGVSAGSLPSLAYCTYLLTKNGTWGDIFCCGKASEEGEKDAAGTPHSLEHNIYTLVLVLIPMALLWFGGFALYGIGAALLGDMGNVVGWPLYMNAIILAANIGGVAAGEWKGSSTQAQKWMSGGLLLLIVAVVVIGYGNEAS